jgi:hypothetical protein
MMEGATWCQLVDLNEYANGGGGGWVGERVYSTLANAMMSFPSFSIGYVFDYVAITLNSIVIL